MRAVFRGPIHHAHFAQGHAGKRVVTFLRDFLQRIAMQHGDVCGMRRIRNAKRHHSGGRCEPAHNRRAGDNSFGPAECRREFSFTVGINLFARAFVHFHPYGALGIVRHAHDGSHEIRRLVHGSSARYRDSPKMLGREHIRRAAGEGEIFSVIGPGDSRDRIADLRHSASARRIADVNCSALIVMPDFLELGDDGKLRAVRGPREIGDIAQLRAPPGAFATARARDVKTGDVVLHHMANFGQGIRRVRIGNGCEAVAIRRKRRVPHTVGQRNDLRRLGGHQRHNCELILFGYLERSVERRSVFHETLRFE